MATAQHKKSKTKKPSAQKKPVAKPKKSASAPKPKKSPSLALMKFPRPSATYQASAKAQPVMSPRLQAAVDKSEITDVLTCFARGIDRLDENLLRSVLHHDATLDFGPGVYQGTASDFVHWVLGVFQGVRSSHHMISNVRIELEGDSALVEAYFHTHLRIEKPVGREDVFLGGRNLDRFERRPTGAAGVWKIAHRKQVLDWARTEAASDIFYHQNPDAIWSSRTKTDLSYQMANFPGSQSNGKLPAFLGRHYETKSVKF
ncbi:MAG: nuclear transport factor 2 family protein [Alphaproteobacteria bacterium]|nr:nuclear transport factor 2 family protein [Alphaproteobacteria bacterium]